MADWAVNLRSLLHEDPVSPHWDSVREALFDGPIDSVWTILVEIFERADLDDEDWLCSLGVNVLEPLIKARWNDILPRMIDIGESRTLRRALSCTWLNGLPREAEAMLEALLPAPDGLDDIGRAT